MNRKVIFLKKAIYTFLILIVLIFFIFLFNKRISQITQYQSVRRIIQPFVREKEEQMSDEELITQAKKVVELWYRASDENNEKKLKSLLAVRWFRPARASQLRDLLNCWLFSPEDVEKGYKGLTRKVEFKSAKVFKSVYGRVVKLWVVEESDVWDSFGHRLINGETTFIITFEKEKESSSFEPKIRDITSRVLRKSK